MSATKALADALYREEVARARAMDPGDKLLEGARLFERATRVMLDGIRHAHPDLDDTEAQTLLVDRLNRLQVLDAQ